MVFAYSVSHPDKIPFYLFLFIYNVVLPTLLWCQFDATQQWADAASVESKSMGGLSSTLWVIAT